MFKVLVELMSAIPASEYFDPVQNKRRIGATSYKDYQKQQTLCSHELKNSNML